MKLAYNLTVLILAVGLFLPTARAGDQRPIVAVFDIQTKRVKLTKSQQGILTDVMHPGSGTMVRWTHCHV